MANKQELYKTFEKFMTTVLFLNFGIFVMYLVCSGLNILVMKIIGSLCCVVVSGYCLWLLYKTKEMLRPRSLWLTCGHGALVLLTIVSLICSFP